MINTEAVILRKQLYREESLLLSALSPDYGRIDLVARGCAKSGSKKFPALDLFRHVEIQIQGDEPAELNTIYSADFLSSFDNIALVREKFEFAVKAGAFLLRNIQSNLPAPMLFDAWRRVLEELNKTDGWSVGICSVAVKLTFLAENGMLPEIKIADLEKAELMQSFIDRIIECAISGEELPDLPPELWRELGNYANNLIKFHQLPWS